MKPRVYLETSFISYLVSNASREPLQRSVNLAVISAGEPAQVQKRIAALGETRILPLNREIIELSEYLLVPSCIALVAASDAIHVAAATIYHCNYLLTWNFRHIANARIRRNAERIIESHGYQSPIICTPDELSESPTGE